jgi:hypothetical protein
MIQYRRSLLHSLFAPSTLSILVAGCAATRGPRRRTPMAPGASATEFPFLGDPASPAEAGSL